MRALLSKQVPEELATENPDNSQLQAPYDTGKTAASSHHEMDASPGPPLPLMELPYELLAVVVSFLDNRDIKNLRLTNSLFLTVSTLRLKRVFLSANPRNIEVFRAIADHETLRQAIVEIIYDDAHLATSAHDAAVKPRHPHAEVRDLEWFETALKENLEEISFRRHGDTDRKERDARARKVATQRTLGESWAYYWDLVRQQNDVIAPGADVDALRYGLQRFPSLRRVTITPAAHGWLFSPLYETPMIRAFPRGFNYPIPRGWPSCGEAEDVPEAYAWEGVDPRGIHSNKVKAKWRGFCLVTRVLAEERHHHNISEFLIDAHHLYTGLNCRVFQQPCDEYTNLVSILRQPGLRHFSLSLLVGSQHRHGWPALRSGLLRKALAEAKDLQHVSLTTDVSFNVGLDGFEPVSLRTIIPIDRWPQLQHLRLCNHLVQSADLLVFLAVLPITLRSIELSYLTFTDSERGNYRDFLSGMRSTLGWRERRPRPIVRIATPYPHPSAGRAIWIDKEVEDFLYGDGENPFGRSGWTLDDVREGFGVIRDAFEPAFERPWMG